MAAELKQPSYTAYVSSYTNGTKDNCGIHVYDVDVQNGTMKEKEKINISNSSYLTLSKSGKYLYSITDFGVEAFKIKKDGSLEGLNTASINGMRGCYITTDHKDRYLFVAGYHDGKITVLRLEKDGKVGEITDEIFHKGLGLGRGRANMAHVECCRVTMDDRYLWACDSGMDRTIVYGINYDNGKLTQEEIVHADPGSSPRLVKFSRDGKFAYILCEQKAVIDVYSYDNSKGEPEIERIQQISTSWGDDPLPTTASALNFSGSFKYLVSSDMTTNEVIIFNSESKDGKLKEILSLPIGGAYPKDARLFPDDKHLVSLNHESNSMTFFSFNEKKKTLIMRGKPLRVDSPNCIVFHAL